jgi:hypothetical protein
MIEFKQGQDPYTTMEIGSTRPVVSRDKFELLTDFVFITLTQPFNFDALHIVGWTPKINGTVYRLEDSQFMAIGTVIDVIDSYTNGESVDIHRSDQRYDTWVDRTWFNKQLEQKNIKRVS